MDKFKKLDKNNSLKNILILSLLLLLLLFTNYTECQTTTWVLTSEELGINIGDDLTSASTMYFWSVRPGAAPQDDGYFYFGTSNFTERSSTDVNCCVISYQCTTAQQNDPCAYHVLRSMPEDSQVTVTNNNSFISLVTNKISFPLATPPPNPTITWTYLVEEYHNSTSNYTTVAATVTISGWTFATGSKGVHVFLKLGTQDMSLVNAVLNPGNEATGSGFTVTSYSGFDSLSIVTLAKELQAELLFPCNATVDGVQRSINKTGPYASYTTYERLVRISFPAFTTSASYTVNVRLKKTSEYTAPKGAVGPPGSESSGTTITPTQIAIIVACIGAFCICFFLCCCCVVWRHHKHKHHSKSSSSSSEEMH